MNNVINTLLHKPTLHYVPISQIEVDPNQPRRELEAPDEVNEARTLAGLAESIKQYGILQPLRVCAVDAQRFRIISGERRYQAALIAQLFEVPVMVIEHAQVLLEQLTENIQRKAMTPLELADAIQQLMQEGLSGRDIAQKLGFNTMQVSILNKLRTVSQPIREALQERLIVSARAAYDMDKLPREKQFELIAQARNKKQVIGQAEVRVARKTLSESRCIKPYSSPLLAKNEYDALMLILNQEVEDEQYDPSADRLAIFGAGDHKPNLGINFEEKTANKNNDSFVAPLPAEDFILSVKFYDPHFENNCDVRNTVNGNSNDRELYATDKAALFRVPSFTLRAEELEAIAGYLQEELPPGLADPGGWLVDVIKRRGRGE